MTETSAEVNAWHVKVDAIERWLRPLFRKYSSLGGPAYFDTSEFPVAKKLEENHEVIRAEFDKARVRMDDFPLFQDISPEQVYISNDDKYSRDYIIVLLLDELIRTRSRLRGSIETLLAINTINHKTNHYLFQPPTRDR